MDHLGANLDFEFCIQRESVLYELSVAVYCASLAGSASKMHLRNLWNYERCVFKKTTLKHLRTSSKTTTFRILPCHGTLS